MINNTHEIINTSLKLNKITQIINAFIYNICIINNYYIIVPFIQYMFIIDRSASHPFSLCLTLFHRPIQKIWIVFK